MSKTIIKLSINQAAAEFGVDRRTLNKHLANVKPDFDKGYSIRQVHLALQPADIDAERLELVRAQTRQADQNADRLELENAEKRKELLPVPILAQFLTNAFTGIRARVLACSNMEQEDRAKLLLEIRDMVAGAFKACGTAPPGQQAAGSLPPAP